MTMTLNIFALTIIIKKRKISLKEAVHQEVAEKLYQENKDRAYSMNLWI